MNWRARDLGVLSIPKLTFSVIYFDGNLEPVSYAARFEGEGILELIRSGRIPQLRFSVVYLS